MIRKSVIDNCDDVQWKSAICLLKGQIYEALDNRNAAVECFREALKANVYCYEAFQSLTQHQMLTVQEGIAVSV